MAVEAHLYSDNFGFLFGGAQNWTNNGCGFNLPPKVQQPELQNQQQKTQSACFDTNRNSVALSQMVAAEIDKERQEVDRIISLQNERLRLALQEKRRQETDLVLSKIEAKAAVLLRQKDEELAKAMNRNMELEEILRRLDIENQTWQRVAREHEAVAVSLRSTIEQQLKENASCFASDGIEEDAESCCALVDGGGVREEDETGGNRGEQQRRREMVCRGCESRNPCVIFLPCMHLCSCQECEAFLDSCPVCGMLKSASVEALF